MSDSDEEVRYRRRELPDDGVRRDVDHPDEAWDLIAAALACRCWVTIHLHGRADAHGTVTSMNNRSAYLSHGGQFGEFGQAIAPWEVEGITVG